MKEHASVSWKYIDPVVRCPVDETIALLISFASKRVRGLITP
jgi:hypothetical protein